MPTSAQIKEAKNWIADCAWEEGFDTEDILAMTDQQVIAGVNRHYSGGWTQFILDGN